jgi:uncharacterized protein (DUF2235 family)
MALYAFDGTGNEDQKEDEKDSNVVDFFEAYIDPQGKKNSDPDEELGSLYLKGIGTRAKTIFGKGPAEAFGFGGHSRVRQAMERLENNIEAGDTKIDIIGFSRGAALAMSFANEIAAKMHEQPVRFIGVFDVVAQFGLPGRFIQAGHVVSLPRNVECCRHAMALDESRAFFPLTRLCDNKGDHDDRLVELWFRGVHSDIGGGNGNRGMNWISLNWMFNQAKRANVPIAPEAIEKNLRDRGLPQQVSKHDLDARIERHCFDKDCLHSSVVLGPGTGGVRLNNPTVVLRRMDDEGNFVTVVQT